MLLKPGFAEEQDEATGETYYHNAATGAAEWDAPLIDGLRHVNEHAAAEGVAEEEEASEEPLAFESSDAADDMGEI